MLYSKEEIVDAFTKARSRSDVCRILGFSINGAGLRKVNKWKDEYLINIDHFVTGAEKNRKYPLIDKECPVCKKIFQTSQALKKNKTTCSQSCANTYFHSGTDNGNWKHGRCYTRSGLCVLEPGYRTTCFQYYERKCAICGWDKCVDVHHVDGNSKNNEYINLIPLCANHHRLTIMREYRDEIKVEIEQIVKNKFPSV
jgi:hypothetical protein